jgi:hypothetical protein
VCFFAEKSWYIAVFALVTDGLAFRVSSGKKASFWTLCIKKQKTSAR